MKKVKVWSRGSLLRLFSQCFILPVRIIFHVDIYVPKHARTHSHTKPYTPVWRPKKNKKYQRILNIERLLKRLFSSSFFILQTGEVTQSATNNNIFFYTFVFTSCSSSSVLYLSTLSSVLGLNSFLVDYLTDDGGEVGGEKEHTKLPLGLWSIEHNNNNNDLKKKKKKKKK